jgi:aryl-alcohol dehydrogenase-like predicted oxidoreductase
MRYNTLGKTGLRVSVLSFGAATLGEEYGAIDIQVTNRSIDYAVGCIYYSPTSQVLEMSFVFVG